MPESTTTSLLPYVTFSVGFAMKIITDFIGHRLTESREREARKEARRDQLYERRTTFQRETLLHLQDASYEVLETTYAANAKVPKARFEEAGALSFSRVFRFGARVRDHEVRKLAEDLTSNAIKVYGGKSEDEIAKALDEMNNTTHELNDRIGKILRQIDDAEEAGSGS